MPTPLSESGNKKPKFGKKNKTTTTKNSFCCIWHLCQVCFPEARENYTQAGIFQKCANDLLSQICRANKEILVLKKHLPTPVSSLNS